MVDMRVSADSTVQPGNIREDGEYMPSRVGAWGVASFDVAEGQHNPERATEVVR